jgi:hypothetical protein
VLVLDRLILSDEALIERRVPPARVRLKDRSILNELIDHLKAEKGGSPRAEDPDYRITFYSEGREIDRVWLEKARARWGFRDHPAVLGSAHRDLVLLLDRLLVPDDVLPKEED